MAKSLEDYFVTRADGSVPSPWGDLGVKVPAGASVKQMLELAKLDWEVVKEPSYSLFHNKDGDPEFRKIDSAFHLRRADRDATGTPWDKPIEVLTPYVGSHYKPVQNADAFQVFDDFVRAGNMDMDTAGYLNDGRIIWGLASIRDGFKLAEGDEIHGYLLLSQSHKYGNAMRVSFTTKRVPTETTLTEAFRQGVNAPKGVTGVFTMSHSRSFNEREIERIKATIGVAKAKLHQFERSARTLVATKMTETKAVEYVLNVFDPKAVVEFNTAGVSLPESFLELSVDEVANRAAKNFLNHTSKMPGLDLPTCDGTAWGWWNRIAFYFDHVHGRSTSSRMESAWFGANAKMKSRALELALNMAKQTEVS